MQACAKNPIKRAVRLDKVRLAALEATLRLYRDPDRLAETLPTLRFFTRTPGDLRDLADQLLPALAHLAEQGFAIEIRDCASEIGSGALPLETIPSVGLALRPVGKVASGRRIEALAAAFRALPIPVIGRIEKGALLLDLRCLDDKDAFMSQMVRLRVATPVPADCADQASP